MILPKVIFTDIDGVWTDGGMYYDQTGNEWKKFNTSDSAGVLFCKKLNIPLVIITGENTQIVARRAEKLAIHQVYQGITNKVEIANKVCKEYNVKLNECAHIGDDIGDYHLLKSVGFSASPNNAPDYIKSVTNYICIKNGGDGAFREFVEVILKKCNINIADFL
jgi:3-deoxy-D-glycero-D-galacto-nononate 9-phosphatase